ncbi:MAG TPA: hypothetical protein VHX66_05585 [Solirubrobacteraceae bacterium]|jgi:hypothetical protein|nr:hypothetical protein [Solirubrobacteraceae bacterium]
MSEILVVANETVGGRKLRDLLEQKAKVNPSLHVRLVIPQSRPRRGSVIYVQSVRDAAQVRLDLALSVLEELGFEATGEVGDSDPFHATMDAIAERKPDEIVISTLPTTASGWLRRDLVERVAEASGIAVQHVISDIDEDSTPPNDTSLVVANQTAGSSELAAHLKEIAAKAEGESQFIVVVPALGGDGKAIGDAQKHLADVLAGLRDAGLIVSGLVGDPDPFTATLNALQFFNVTRVVISTLPETKSGWLRADLVERVRRYAVCPVEHFVASSTEPVAAS